MSPRRINRHRGDCVAIVARIGKGIAAKLAKFAGPRGLSKTEVIEQALELYFDRYEAMSQAVPFDPAAPPTQALDRESGPTQIHAAMDAIRNSKDPSLADTVSPMATEELTLRPVLMALQANFLRAVTMGDSMKAVEIGDAIRKVAVAEKLLQPVQPVKRVEIALVGLASREEARDLLIEALESGNIQCALLEDLREDKAQEERKK